MAIVNARTDAVVGELRGRSRPPHFPQACDGRSRRAPHRRIVGQEVRLTGVEDEVAAIAICVPCEDLVM